MQEQLICPGRSCTFFLQSSIKQWRDHADRLVGAGPVNQDECATQAPLHIHPVPGPLPEGQNVGNMSLAHCRPRNECATPSGVAGGFGWVARRGVPCCRGAGWLQRVLVAGTPTSLVAGVGVVPRCRATPASGCSRGWGPEAGPQGRTVRVGVALTRWRRGGPPAGPYGAETPARATARHGPARAGSTRAQMACDEPGRCVAGRGHGTAWLGSGGPRSSRPGSAAAWAGAGTEVTEGGAVLPSSVAPLPRPRALSWLRPPAAVWARAGLGEDVGRTGPNYRAGWSGSPYHAEDPARSPPVTARARTGGTEVPPRHPRAHYHAGKGRRTWCGLVTSCPRRLGAE